MNPISDAALAQHITVLGKTGSGKTSTEKLIVEQVAAAGFRVCVLDTIKSDWWGITSSADGKRPGHPFKILGGPRGHVPLHSSAGKVIGQLVGTGKLPLSIVDMADFEAGGVQRFFVDFAQALWKSVRGVVYLVIEEAHEIAPKERAGFGAENLSIHWAKKLATGSRTKGIRLIVATQRAQALHNAVLGSCETLIAHRLTLDADQEPVVKWLKNANKAMAGEVAESLSSLPDGTGWLCSGSARIFEKVAFPKFKTYDNTKTPTGDGAEVAVKSAPVDQDELRELIGDAVKTAEADDPKALRKRIAELERAATQKAAPAQPQQSDTKAIEAAANAGYDQAVRDSASWHAPSLVKIGDDVKALLSTHMEAMPGAIRAIKKKIDSEVAVLNRQWSKGHPATAPIPDGLKKIISGSPASASGPTPAAAHTSPERPRTSSTRSATPSPAGRGDGTLSDDGVLTNPQLNLLRSLAWWRAMGHEEPTRAQAAAIAGWKPSGSNLKDRLSELARADLVVYPRMGIVKLTDAGIAAAPAPDTNRTLLDSIRGILTGPQLRLFEALVELDAETERAELAQKVGWEPGGSNLKDRLSELSRLELVEYPQRGAVQLQAWVIA